MEIARTALTTVTILCGLLLIPFVEPPTKWWVGGDLLSGDRGPSLLAFGMLALVRRDRRRAAPPRVL